MNRRLAIGIGTAVAVVLAGGGILALTWPSDGSARADAAGITSIPPDPNAKPPAVRATIAELDLTAAVTAAGALDLPQRATKPFTMVSASWTDPAAHPQGAVQVRARSAKTGTWSGWQELPVAEEAADRPAEAARTHGATDPIWAGRSDGVAARIAGAGAGLPAGLHLNLIDTDVRTGGSSSSSSGGQGGGEGDPIDSPSAQASTPATADPSGDVPTEPTNPPVTDVPTVPTTEPVPTSTPESPPTTEPETSAPATTTTTVAAPSASTTVPVSTDPVKAQLPPYVSRLGWGANEALVKFPVDVAPAAKMVWVHHTGFDHGYTCADSPSVIRGIQANDVQEKGLDDIGYNFLVDKCGTLFEGRMGGVATAVIGAHTIGFNTGSVGVALLGDYTTATPTEAAETTIAQLAAARLGAYGFNPTSTAEMTEGTTGRKWPMNSQVTFPRIAGHKDGEMTDAGYLTVCPGTTLYADLPAIRARSVQMITGLAANSLGGGLSTGGTFYVRSTVTIAWSVDTPSESIARFELLRDGAVAATLPGAARSGSYPLAPGAHTIQVRAVHVSGATAVTPAYRVVADVTAPSFPAAPAPSLRTGTYSTTSAPVAVNYRAADNVKLWTVTATSPARVNLAPTATVWYAAMRPGANTAFTVTARDVPGNARTVSVTRKATLLAETAAKRGGSWSTRSSASYLSGRALAATGKGARLTYTFTGRSAALIFSRAAKTGQAYVYLDGKKVATLDTRSTKTAYRQALWVRALTPGKHTVAVVVVGTSGRPTVVSDGLAYIG